CSGPVDRQQRLAEHSLALPLIPTPIVKCEPRPKRRGFFSFYRPRFKAMTQEAVQGSPSDADGKYYVSVF
ncbi:hypothetical protein, partial [Agrobacterium pusense]